MVGADRSHTAPRLRPFGKGSGLRVHVVLRECGPTMFWLQHCSGTAAVQLVGHSVIDGLAVV